jgi:hypothetical protein
MTEDEIKRKKAAADSAAFDNNFAADVARYACEWSPSSAANTMPWNANGIHSSDSVFTNEEALAERDLIHDHACSLVSAAGLSGERGLAAYNLVAMAYDAYIKKGAAADPDLAPSSVMNSDSFFRTVSKA